MKVIFLDIDGILNTHTSSGYPKVPVHFKGDIIMFNQLDQDCVARLNEITDATDAVLVISSTWRKTLDHTGQFGSLMQHFKQQGVTGDVIGYTPVTWGELRNHEIKLWFEERKDTRNIEKYVILDDDLKFFAFHKPDNMVYVENGWMTGIQDEHVKEAIEILNESTDLV